MTETPPVAPVPPTAERPPQDLLGQPLTGEGTWSSVTRDRAVAVLFVITGVFVVLLIWPFLDALLFASATVVVTWPIFQRVLARTGGRTAVAAALTSGGIGLLVLAPLSLLGVWFVQEVLQAVNEIVRLADAGKLQEQTTALFASVGPLTDEIFARTGYRLDPATFVAPLQRATVSAGQGLARTLPTWVGSIFVAALDALVYLFAVVSLYMEGPRFLHAVMRLSPMRKEHDRRLFEVFREFSTNLVFGAVGTATVQGFVGFVGFAIASVPNLLLISLLTTVFGFVPFVGTAMIWVPVTIWVWSTRGWGWGLFLLFWNLAFTGSVDNLVRPFLLRGRSPIHPLPIFLAVLGGIAWMGLPGALVGPVGVAMFLALYQIWCEQIGSGPAGPQHAEPDAAHSARVPTPVPDQAPARS
jgi:predicted PurR-regulated permease PerM